MRLAAIDIGTNSTKATVADCDGGALTVISEDSEVTRLGQGVDASKALNEQAMERTLSAVVRLADAARALGAEKIVAAGTSALRDASNGPDFLRRIQENAGVDVEIVTGDREAALAYQAVRHDADLRLPEDAPLLVFDIGGGSTELVLGQGADVRGHTSLDIGAVRLTERCLHADPPTDDEIAGGIAMADGLLGGFRAEPLPARVVGIGGTVVNLASMARGLPRTDPDAVHAATLSAADVDAAIQRFRAVPVAARREIPGLEPARADIILGGALILSRLLIRFRADRFLVSARGLRYGLLAEAAGL